MITHSAFLLAGTEVLIEETATEHYSLIGLAAKGGWLMLVLLALSILAIYIFGEKFWEIRKASKVSKKFLNKVRTLIAEGKTAEAKAICKKNDTPVARLIEKGIERIGRPLPDIQAAIENLGNVEVAKLEKGLPMLATISGGAPMIGFLGTVTGMIRAFFNMARAGSNVDITLLSGGIYEAMLTTVGGLFVGIIAYFGYNFLTSRISDIVFRMESVTIEFMDMLNSPASKLEAPAKENSQKSK